MQQPLLVYLHIPKTAGSSFKEWIAASFGRDVLIHMVSLPVANIGISYEARAAAHSASLSGARVVDIKQYFQANGVAGFSDIRAMGGHFTAEANFVTAVADRAVLCAGVRDPVERAVSLYLWIKRKQNHNLHLEMRDRSLLESVAENEQFNKLISNRQMTTLFGRQNRRDGWMIVCNYRRHDLLMQRISEIFVGMTPAPLAFRNRADDADKARVTRQPGYEEACERILALNLAEKAFVDSIDGMAEFNTPPPYARTHAAQTAVGI